jgi:hypothetical protein
MSDETKPGAPSTLPPLAEPVASNRRAFMKSVVTGAVAVGVVSTAGKAEAQSQAASCVTPTQMPSTPSTVKVLFNKNRPPKLEDIYNILVQTFQPTGCPNCGLGGVINRPDIIQNVSIDVAYMAEEVPSIVLVQDAKAGF